MAKKLFQVQAGRQIYFNYEPFIGISKSGETPPVEADAMTHLIAELLNKYGPEKVADYLDDYLGQG